MREAVRDLVRLWRHPRGREALHLPLHFIARVLRLDWIGKL
jgi:hypothetical protein